MTAPARPLLPTLLGYALMLAAAAALYALILRAGSSLAPPPLATHAAPPAAGAHASPLVAVLIALACVTLTARAIGAVFERWLRQPPVLGEIVAGLLLGPSALGAISPTAQAMVIHPAAVPHLGMLSQVGVVLFMFVVGTELDTKLLRRNPHGTVAISHASIVAPFLLGAATALWLHPRYGTRGVSFLVFSLFLGVSLSVTAFPVLARILTDRGLHRTALGATALACAAVADVTAWVMLAFVAGVARADLSGPARLLPWALAYLVVMLVGVRPLVRRVSDAVERTGAPAGRGALSAAFVGLLLSAAATEALGVHALFGAFLFGALLPRDGRLATDLRRALEDLVVVLFLPAFFAVTGLRTRIGLVAGWSDAFVCGLIVAVATVGKFGGTLAAAKLTGHGWRDSVALGTLMNTRGLMELIVLNVGLDLGVIEPRLFAMLVIMALVTTFATSPVLSLLLGRGEATNEPLQAPATARP